MRTTRISEAAASKDGLPRSAFAYAPTAKPADWKIPIYKADGTVDEDRLGPAAASLSEGGFRGEKAAIPAAAVASVKAKIRSAYRKAKGSDAEYPDSIKESVVIAESEGGEVTIREATVLLDKSAVSATVVIAPNGDTLVIPCWDGQFQSLAKPYAEPDAPSDSWQTSYDVSDVAQAIATLTRIRNHEEPEQVAMLTQAINYAADFIRAEATEPVTEAAADPAALLVALDEAGKRNNASDQKMIQQIHDASHTLGAQHDPETTYAGMQESAAVVEPTGDKTLVNFAESGGDAVYVMLSEASATFDDATRTVTITPIKPGFGNKRDGYYYTKDALQEATVGGMFDGLKMFRNHPKKSDEKDRPERDINDWFATTRKASWDDAVGEPRLPVVVHEARDYQRWKDAPDQIAFSIRGGGYARPGRVNGTEAKIIESLAKVRSVDWVTEAGAGGAITFAESAAEEFDVDIKTLSIEQLREELRLREADTEAPAADGEDKDKAPAAPAAEPPAPEATKGGEAPAAAPEGFVSKADVESMIAAAMAAPKIEAEVKEAAAKAVKAEIDATVLPKHAKDVVAAKFAEAAYGNGFAYTDEPALRGAVKAELDSAARILGGSPKPSPVRGLGAASGSEPATISESVKASLTDRWGADRIPQAQVTVIPANKLSEAFTPVHPERTDDDGEDDAKPSNLSEAAAGMEDSLYDRIR